MKRPALAGLFMSCCFLSLVDNEWASEHAVGPFAPDEVGSGRPIAHFDGHAVLSAGNLTVVEEGNFCTACIEHGNSHLALLVQIQIHPGRVARGHG